MNYNATNAEIARAYRSICESYDEDGRYEELVERDDEYQSERMLEEAAKRKMPNTKVDVDEPLLHCSRSMFTRFDGRFVGRTGADDTGCGEAYFFTSNREIAIRSALTNGDMSYADGAAVYVYEVFLNITNPLEYSDSDGGFGAFSIKRMAEVIRSAKAAGNDGVIVYDGYGMTAVAFSPYQIKLACVTYDDDGVLIPLSSRFDFNSDDMRY